LIGETSRSRRMKNKVEYIKKKERGKTEVKMLWDEV
jgi:hypothetical protein